MPGTNDAYDNASPQSSRGGVAESPSSTSFREQRKMTIGRQVALEAAASTDRDCAPSPRATAQRVARRGSAGSEDSQSSIRRGSLLS
eukprot:gene22691-834_t